ncbi:hypothetical protein [Candidatus Methanoprimaticola sp. MG2]|uniref:hypothetical protein n=1 Tax=Candidatus Methanoprimaticola sp. MG2 TaxID=3228838 RepID=UPI0039C70535
MPHKNDSLDGCIIITRIFPCHASTETDCTVEFRSEKIENNNKNIRHRLAKLVHISINGAIDLVLNIAAKDLYNLSKAVISFDYTSGVYTILHYITPEKVAKSLVKTTGINIIYEIAQNKDRYQTIICKQVNAYLKSRKGLNNMKARVGIHTFDDLVQLCKEELN